MQLHGSASRINTILQNGVTKACSHCLTHSLSDSVAQGHLCWTVDGFTNDDFQTAALTRQGSVVSDRTTKKTQAEKARAKKEAEEATLNFEIDEVGERWILFVRE